MDGALDEATIAAIRPSLDPEDRDAPPDVLDRGFGSLAVRFGGTVARIPVTAEVASSHTRELETLPVVATRLPVAVPSPARPVRSGPALSFGALLHPWLPGTVMTEGDAVRHETLADEIATCLAALHAIDANAFPAGSLREMDPARTLEDLERQTAVWLEDRLDGDARSILGTLLARAHTVLPARDRVVCHGDPWFGNMLLDEEGHLSALLDFEGMSHADPAYDLAALTYLEPPSADAAIAAYIARTHPLEDLHGRVQAYLLIRELWGLAYGLRNGLVDETEHAFGGLTDILGQA